MVQNRGRDFGNNRQLINSNARANNNNNNNRNNNNNNNGPPLHCSFCNKAGHEVINCYTRLRNERNNINVPKNAIVPSGGVRLVQEILNTESPQDNVFMSQQ